MGKLKSPLLSLEASGSLGNALTFQRSRRENIIRGKPVPPNTRTLSQLYQRWSYQDGCFYWRTLTPTQKAVYRAAASRNHSTMFAEFMSYYLTNLPDLAALWRLDERLGTVLRDSSKNAHTGTSIGTSSVPGTIDNARRFDGLDDYITVDMTPTLVPADMTIILWLKPLTTAGAFIIAARKDANYAFALGKHPGGYFYLQMEKATIAYQKRTSGHDYTALPQLLAATWNGTTHAIQLSRNAVLDTITSVDQIAGLPSATILNLGRRPGQNDSYTNGWEDHVAIYSRILTQEHLEKIFERRYP